MDGNPKLKPCHFEGEVTCLFHEALCDDGIFALHARSGYRYCCPKECGECDDDTQHECNGNAMSARERANPKCCHRFLSASGSNDIDFKAIAAEGKKCQRPGDVACVVENSKEIAAVAHQAANHEAARNHDHNLHVKKGRKRSMTGLKGSAAGRPGM